MCDDERLASMGNARRLRDQKRWYDANFDEELLRERAQAERICHQFNAFDPDDEEGRRTLLAHMFSELGEGATVLPPLYVDYGYNCRVGEGTFINRGAYLMDGAPITIGDHVFIGPGCGMYTAEHPLTVEERNQGLERALPITIEDDVWIGGNVVILPGVTIGRGSVIGAHSTVTRDVPAGVVAVGSPCRVVRAITPDDAPSDKEAEDEA